MAQTTPTTFELRVRFWHPETLDHLWTSACDIAELAEETRQALECRVEAGEWIIATVDLVPSGSGPEVRGDWRTRWSGKARINPVTGVLEMARHSDFLNKMFMPTNPFTAEEVPADE